MHKGFLDVKSELDKQLQQQRFQPIMIDESNPKEILNNSLKERIVVFGIGQAGSNIAKIFNDNGFNSAIVNTSEEDLKTISGIKKYHITNGEGAGKERKTAKELLKNDSENILSFVEAGIKGKDIVLMCCSTAGGTGSGIVPSITRKMLNDNKNIIVCPVIAIPSDKECFQSKLNSYEFFKELTEIKDIGTIFIINNNKSNDYEFLNATFYNLFLDFITLCDHNSSKGNIDVSELKKMLRSKDVTLISSIQFTDNTDSSDIFVDIREHSISILENDKKVKYIAISIPQRADLNADKTIDDLKKEFGEFPKSIFKGYNDKNKVITILSGLTLPQVKINSYFEEIQTNYQSVKDNFNKRKKLPDLNISFDDEEEDLFDDDLGLDDIFG